MPPERPRGFKMPPQAIQSPTRHHHGICKRPRRLPFPSFALATNTAKTYPGNQHLKFQYYWIGCQQDESPLALFVGAITKNLKITLQ